MKGKMIRKKPDESGEKSGDKKISYLLVSAIFLLTLASAFSIYKILQLDSRPAQKIGYVRSEALVMKYRGAIEINKQMQLEGQGYQKTISDMEGELMALEKDIQKKSAVLSQVALQPQVARFQKKQQEYMEYAQAAQNQMMRRQNELLQPVLDEISFKIEKYGKQNGYSLILGTPVSGLIIYGDVGEDLTDIIAEELNRSLPAELPVFQDTGSVSDSGR